MQEIRQNFLKGINRATTQKESLDPDYFHTLQNVRPLQRGNLGELVRMQGYSKFDTTNFSEVLDIINFREYFVVYRREASTFGVHVYDENGTEIYSSGLGDFPGTPVVTRGKMVQTQNSIYFEPHQMVLYYDGSNWYLSKYKSEIPKINSVTPDTGGGAAFGSTITVDSPPTLPPLQAVGYIRFVKNNTPPDQTDNITIKMDGVTTAPFEVNYQDNPDNIALRAFSVLSASALITNWEFSVVDNVITINAISGQARDGAAGNGVPITLDGNSYNRYDTTTPSDPTFPEFSGGVLGIVESYKQSIMISNPTGGADSTSSLGPIKVIFGSTSFLLDDTSGINTDIAASLAGLLNDVKEITDDYTIAHTPATNTITVTAKNIGPSYNIRIKFEYVEERARRSRPPMFISDAVDTIGGDPTITGTLEPRKNYWYAARYLYIDGHKSKTCLSEPVKTTSVQSVDVEIATSATDLDETRATVQIFRKREGGEFFLIEEISPSSNTTTFTDTGEKELRPLDESDILWYENAKTQEIIDNRLVKANIDYADETYTFASDFNATEFESTDENIIPYNSEIEVFIKPQYSDGTFGYHTKVDTFSLSTNVSRKVSLQQQAAVSNAGGKTITELGVYAKYKPLATEKKFKFNTVEIANKNLPVIGDETLKPSRTRILLGFKYIEVFHYPAPNVLPKFVSMVRVKGWGPEDQERSIRLFDFDYDYSLDGSNNAPPKITVNVFGTDLTYIRHAHKYTSSNKYSTIYKLECFEPLKDAVSSGDLYVELDKEAIRGLSGSIADEELKNSRVRVTGILDYSVNGKSFRYDTTGQLIGPEDSRVYLELEEGAFDEIDNLSVTNYNLSSISQDANSDYWNQFTAQIFSLEDILSTIPFNLTKFEKKADASLIPYTAADAGFDNGRLVKLGDDIEFYRYNWDYDGAYYLYNTKDTLLDDALVYLGKKPNTVTTKVFDQTGFSISKGEYLRYPSFNDHNIIEQIVLADDFDLTETSFPNQLIWTSPIIDRKTFGGGRDIRAINFFNLDSRYGEILDIESLSGNLIAFCNRGVALITVGQVLTQQKSGGVFVDTSGFLNDYIWIKENLRDLKQDSITKVGETIFFTDGFDVFMVSGNQVQNITQGIIQFNQDNTFVGGYNSKYNEYWLYDLEGNISYSFGLDTGQWAGPHTLVFERTGFYKDVNIGYDGINLQQLDTGNDFDGTVFTSVIESVANDTQIGTVDKRFRKFYMDIDGFAQLGPIVAVNNFAERVEVVGDFTSILFPGDTIGITGSTGNDGTYTVSTVTYNAPNTEIVVTGDITDNSSDGYVYSESVQFFYGKDTSSYQTINIGDSSSVSIKNGYYNVGVKPQESNSKKMFWKIASTQTGLRLSNFVTNFIPTKRR